MTDRVRTFLREHLSSERYLHSERTASPAVSLCERFGLDEVRGFLAGPAHDIARDLSKVVYCVDYLEAGRSRLGDEWRTATLLLPLERMVCEVLARTIRYLESRNLPVWERSRKLFSELCGNETGKEL